ncbi:TrkH family potassium uptake protein [Bacillus tuaregi]|uniref:TrkH family potassium uptake protein n=1 Tax=Bacillus tuaregi TaxID=1816695 RepID=UPI0008F7FB52|nr:TrkH family potassium uptake protein [Bacillus tuaregi]
MNYLNVFKVTGFILFIESFLMIPPLLISMYYHQSDQYAFLISIIIIAAMGVPLAVLKTSTHSIKIKEGLAIVTLGWLLTSALGAMPYVISGSIPSYVDAFFETVSGLTTTGASIVNDVESLPRGILFWRSFTHWIGGMGILVFTIALLPTIGAGGFQLFKAESPGPISDKIVPGIKKTAIILYLTYLTLTLLEMILLVIGGMSWYESALHTFGTVGTGGFSTRNASIAAFDSNYIQLVIAVFMVLAGVNFSLFFFLFKRKWRDIFGNEEFRLYLCIILTTTVLIASNLYFTAYEGRLGTSIRDAFFQVSSIMSTTGYATADYNQWPTFSKNILFLLMFIGGSAGSTTGAIKVLRILILFKLIKRELLKIQHPRAVMAIKLQNKALSSGVTTSIVSFFVLYILLFIGGTVFISLEDIGLESAASAVAATLGNIGPGFGLVGPTENFSGFSDFSKIIFSILMLFGRLELFTILAFIMPLNVRKEKHKGFKEYKA